MNRRKIVRLCLEAIFFSVLAITFYMNNLGLLVLVIFFIILIDNIYILTSMYKQKKTEDSISQKISESIYSNINNVILPILVVKENGEILWESSRFYLLEKNSIIGKNIGSIIKGIDLKKIISSDKENSHQRLKFKGRTYDIQGSSISINKETFGIAFLNDVSDLLQCGNNKESVLLLEIDNYSDAVESIDEDQKPILIAEMEKTIYSYAQNLKAMIKKYENNKYVLTVQDKYIDEQINEGFTILDNISGIHIGNKLEPTLSIGIGRGGATPQENSKHAKFAKELALGRGGDQVVIKNNNDIKFFGGNTKEVEKENEGESQSCF